ncbi:UNVERIFIED_CONTAM: hypothetical protein FKN15_020133 [Acipenser sinensis]
MKTKAGRECLATRKRVGEEKLNADNLAADMLYLARRGPWTNGMFSPKAGKIDDKTDFLKKSLREYGLVTPISTDSEGHYLSNLLSASHKQRIKRDVSKDADHENKQLFFNVTAFGREFHLRLHLNSRLVAPGAVVEWHEEGGESEKGAGVGNGNHTLYSTERIVKKEVLRTDCAYIGDITDIPGATVAISNCDGLYDDEEHRV